MPKWNVCKYSLTCNVLILRLAYKILAFVYVFMKICFWWDKKIPFPLPSLVKAVAFFTLCFEGHLLYFFWMQFFLWSRWFVSCCFGFSCLFPGEVWSCQDFLSVQCPARFWQRGLTPYIMEKINLVDTMIIFWF